MAVLKSNPTGLSIKILSRSFIILHVGYLIFSLGGVMLKFASGYTLFSFPFFLLYAGSLFCVCIFAFIWQQVLQRYDLMAAYAWRGVMFLWTFLWSVVFFGEQITMNNILGAVIIVAGMMLVIKSE